MFIMSEDRSRFKIKKGDIEIEYEGRSEEVSKQYKEAFEWIRTSVTRTRKLEPARDEEVMLKKKKGKRGGLRPPVISPEIDKMIDEGFFDDFRHPNQVFEELRRRNVPISNIKAVVAALNRRVPKKLDRIKDDKGDWVYRKRQ